MFSCAIVSFALATSALANVFLTSPVASTTFTAGQSATVAWQDDGSSPSLAQFGLANFGIYAGNALQQTLLQTIASSVNVSSTSSVTFTPDGTIGPNSGEYFVRVTSLTLMDSSSPQYPAEAFSAKFTMASMTGTFNSSVQAEINGQSTAPIGATATPAPSSAPAMTTPVVSAPASSSSSHPASSATPASTNGAGKPVIATGFVALVAVLIGASLL